MNPHATRHRWSFSLRTLFVVVTVFAVVTALAGVLLKIRTGDGTLVVEIDQPDVVVRVLDKQGKVEITVPVQNGKYSISVDPGRHRLEVEKDGFAVFGQDFVIESGGNAKIMAPLETLTQPVAHFPPATQADRP